MAYKPQVPVQIIYTDTAGPHTHVVSDDDDFAYDNRIAIEADLLIIDGKIYSAKTFVDILEEFNCFHRCPRCKFKFENLEGKCSLASCRFQEAKEKQ